MKYVALIEGEGHGCDYTIDCNKTFMVFEEENDLKAVMYCKEQWSIYKNDDGPTIKSIRLFSIDRTIEVPAETWAEDELRRQIELAEAKIKRLKSRLRAEGENEDVLPF